MKTNKNYLAILAISAALIVFFGSNALAAEQASSTELQDQEAFKAIIKIRTYVPDDVQGHLSLYSEGSGIIISEDGLVLSNHHVVTKENDFDSTYDDAVFQTCIPTDMNKEPECKFLGKLITVNKDQDLSLLQIEPISGMSTQTSFKYLELDTTNSSKVNDDIYVIGYPGIGGDTLTLTKGIISGKLDKYGKNWLKTDAVISFGSSGGAALNTEGKVVGITSAAHSDMIGSLGYIINSYSVISWVDENKDKPVRQEALNTRLIAITKKQEEIKTSNTFTHNEFSYSLTKPQDWTFDYSGELGMTVERKGDDDTGAVGFALSELPYLADFNSIETVLFRAQPDDDSQVSDISINGVKGKSIIGSSDYKKYYIFPYKNYYLLALYDYGKNDKDKVIVQDILNSLTIQPDSSYSEIKEYSNENPKFFIGANKDWAFLASREKSTPLSLGYKPDKRVDASIIINKASEYTKNLDNDGYLKYYLKNLDDTNKMAEIYDRVTTVTGSSAHYKLNKYLDDVIKLEMVVKKNSGNKDILVYIDLFIIKSGDKYIRIELDAYTKDKAAYLKAAGSFNAILQTLNLSGTKISAPEGSVTPTSIISSKTAAKTTAKTAASKTAKTAATAKTPAKKTVSMNERLKGRILIKVEDAGRAYYINPSNKKAYYLAPDNAMQIIKEQGIGIKNSDLEKIPVGDIELTGTDSDLDGLSDAFEAAIGTDKNNSDSDGDGYSDKTEIENGYSSKLKLKKFPNDKNLVNAQKGRILIQVEGKGEAWYLNPSDGKRYFLGRPADAYNVMKLLGLGISNSDYAKLQ